MDIVEYHIISYQIYRALIYHVVFERNVCEEDIVIA